MKSYKLGFYQHILIMLRIHMSYITPIFSGPLN